MQEENLNIDYHVRRLLLIALNKFPTRPLVAKATGLSERTIVRFIERFGIERDFDSGRYSIGKNANINVNDRRIEVRQRRHKRRKTFFGSKLQIGENAHVRTNQYHHGTNMDFL